MLIFINYHKCCNCKHAHLEYNWTSEGLSDWFRNEIGTNKYSEKIIENKLDGHSIARLLITY